jgi:hypothetical protein
MDESNHSIIYSDNQIIEKIHIIRGIKVMLAKDLAEMYAVDVKVLNQAVKRNISCFPQDLMFQLLLEEWHLLTSQFVTSNDKPIKRNPIGVPIPSKKN